jgi:hypothetical protein
MRDSYSRQADQLFDRIRSACPSFVPVDDAASPEWQDEPYPLGYIRVAGLARHLVRLASAGGLTQIVPVLDIAEAVLVDGDEYTQDLVTVGLLEDLQDDCLRTDGRVRLADVRERLGPKSKLAWDDLILFWYGSPDEAARRLPHGSLPDRSWRRRHP